MAFIDACGLSPRLTACRLTTVTGSHQAKERFQLFADERERKKESIDLSKRLAKFLNNFCFSYFYGRKLSFVCVAANDL